MKALIIAVALLAQSSAPATTSFRGRLSPVPVETTTASKITGSGTVTATLDGTKLTIGGTFQGMKSPATIAQVHMGARGVRGPVEFDLTVDKSATGTVSGTIALTKIQIDTLRKGWYYVQIHAQDAPEGNLWGWLLPQQ
jgi:CHRD domain-containing protein